MNSTEIFETHGKTLIALTFSMFSNCYTPSQSNVTAFVKEYIRECLSYDMTGLEMEEGIFDSELFNDWFLD